MLERGLKISNSGADQPHILASPASASFKLGPHLKVEYRTLKDSYA